MQRTDAQVINDISEKLRRLVVEWAVIAEEWNRSEAKVDRNCLEGFELSLATGTMLLEDAFPHAMVKLAQEQADRSTRKITPVVEEKGSDDD